MCREPAPSLLEPWQRCWARGPLGRNAGLEEPSPGTSARLPTPSPASLHRNRTRSEPRMNQRESKGRRNLARRVDKGEVGTCPSPTALPVGAVG